MRKTHGRPLHQTAEQKGLGSEWEKGPGNLIKPCQLVEIAAGTPEWEAWIEFDLNLPGLPKNAKDQTKRARRKCIQEAMQAKKKQAPIRRETFIPPVNLNSTFRLYLRMCDATGEELTSDLIIAWRLHDSNWDSRLEKIEIQVWGDPLVDAITAVVNYERQRHKGISLQLAFHRVAVALEVPAKSFAGALKRVETAYNDGPGGLTGKAPCPTQLGVKGTVKIRVPRGRRVLDPDDNYRVLEADRTYTVPNSHHWRRRLRDGDVVLAGD